MKTVWITGGGSGIGKALALRYADDGWSVVISGRSESRLREVQSLSTKIQIAVCDITQEEDVQRVVKQIGPIDLALLNAGDYSPEQTSETSIQTHREIFEVNYFGTLHCIQAVSPDMQIRGGKIAIVGSLSGYRGLPNSSAYGPSKAALISLCESLRAELQNSPVQIQLINPGFVKSMLTDKNSFEMPFLIEPEVAAKSILRGLETEKFEIAFPPKFVRRMKLLRLLPYRLYFSLMKILIKAE